MKTQQQITYIENLDRKTLLMICRYKNISAHKLSTDEIKKLLIRIK